jgi:two-component system, cell cycle response regulator CpdR
LPYPEASAFFLLSGRGTNLVGTRWPNPDRKAGYPPSLGCVPWPMWSFDDEPLLLEILGSMLEELGLEAVCVDCPIKGLEKLDEDKRIAMVITDIQMPAMTGFELAERARVKRPDLRVVLMSGAHPGRPGFPVIKKPFSASQLAEVTAVIAKQ